MLVILDLDMLRQEDYKVKASLGYIIELQTNLSCELHSENVCMCVCMNVYECVLKIKKMLIEWYLLKYICNKNVYMKYIRAG